AAAAAEAEAAEELRQALAAAGGAQGPPSEAPASRAGSLLEPPALHLSPRQPPRPPRPRPSPSPGRSASRQPPGPPRPRWSPSPGRSASRPRGGRARTPGLSEEVARVASERAARRGAGGPGDLQLSLQELRDPDVWRRRGVEASTREQLLPDREFEEHFGCSKAEFGRWPKWKQDRRKKELGLF
ncbi:unnamed protein product, partial [Prorocentrum cordatum]